MHHRVLYWVLFICFQGISSVSVDSLYESYVTEIPAECITDLSPRTLLPNKRLFVGIKNALRNVINASFPLIISAGQGTSGTRTLFDWCLTTFNQSRSNLHYSVLRSPSHTESKSDFVAEFIDYLHGIYDVRRPHSRYNKSTPPVSITSKEFQQDLAIHVEQVFKDVFASTPPLGCILDNPWTSFFTELFFAACPHVRVVHSVRRAADWARSRIAHHGNGKVSFVCPKEGSHDPFSVTQCGNLTTMRKAQPMTGECLNYIDMSVTALANAYRRYSRYVHRVVPEHLLLEMNLFMSLYHNSTIDPTQWTHGNSHLFQQFVRYKPLP